MEIVARYLRLERTSSYKGKSLLVLVLSTLGEACKNHEQNRDSFEETHMAEV